MNILKRTLAGLLVVFLAFGQVTSIPGIVDAILGASNLTTAGACVYVSASGTLNQDSPGCHWDATNNRLGLGTASPTSTFDILTTSGSAINALARLRNTYSDAYIPILEMLAPNMTAGQEAYSTIGLSATSGNRAGFSFTYAGNNSASNRLTIGNFFGGTGGPLYLLNSGSTGIGPSNTSPTGTLHVYDATASTGVTTLTVRMGSAQSGTDAFRVQNSGGTSLVRVDSSAYLFTLRTYIGPDTSKGYIEESATGGIYFRNAGSGGFAFSNGPMVLDATQYLSFSGRSRIYSPADGSIRLANAAATDFALLQFGGTTKSFPALKRFGNAVAVRAADDTISTFATLTACSASGEGALASISDSATAVWGLVVTGGGSNHILAYCNGTDWTVAAK